MHCTLTSTRKLRPSYMHGEQIYAKISAKYLKRSVKWEVADPKESIQRIPNATKTATGLRMAGIHLGHANGGSVVEVSKIVGAKQRKVWHTHMPTK